MQPMQVQEEEDLDGVMDIDDPIENESKSLFNPEKEKAEEDADGVVDLKDYTDSGEDEKASWWDVAKDVVIQPALGLGSAFTWGLDVLKLGMVGEALTDLDEIEEAFQRVGKKFDRNEYLRVVAEQSEFMPTWDLLESTIEERADISLKAKSETGKTIRKFFNLFGLLKGKGLTKAAVKQGVKGALVGAGTKTALKAAGVNETVSDIVSDIAGGGAAALKKEPRILSKEISDIEKTAAKHGLPFPEYLTKEKDQLIKPKISETRKAAIQKELGMDTRQALDKIIEGELPIKKLKEQGTDLKILRDEAYDKVAELAKNSPKKNSTDQIIKDIDTEIARIKSQAPSPSDPDKAAIRILEAEKEALSNAPKKEVQILGPNGKPLNASPPGRTPKEVKTEDLVEQIKKYNKNVDTIYKRPEFSGQQDAVRSAYAFLNNSIRNTIEHQSGTEIRQAMRAADALHGQINKLNRVEQLISKSFKDGDYSPKKLQQLLNSKQGLIVRRELGDQAVNEIRDIANYGDRAVKATNQLAKSSKHIGEIAEWGALAGYLLYKMPKSAGILMGAKAMGDRIRGYLMTKPAARTAYRDIMKNAANGSFKTMAADFSRLESAVIKDFGSMEEFFKTMQEDLEIISE